MATATYNSTLSTDITNLWRKVQLKVVTGVKLRSEEWSMFDSFRELEDVEYSTREIKQPINITRGYGVSSMPEGGYEARPSSPAPQELSFTWITLNKRFTVSRLTRQVDQRSRRAMISNQIKHQAKQAVLDLARQLSDYTYGYSNGTVCLLSGDPGTAATSHTAVALDDGYGEAGIDDAGYITNMFENGDYVALIRSAALVSSNAIGQISAKNATAGTVTITWNGSVDPANDDAVVKANSLENTTIAGTDYNIAMVGFLDALKSTSLHGLSGTTYPNWSVAQADTSGSRFTGVRIHKMRQLTANKGGKACNTILLAQGVERDMIALYQAAHRYSSTFGMEVDGSIKSKGITFKSTQRVPPGFAIAYDSSTVKKLALLEKPSENEVPWDDADKVQDRSMWVHTIDYPAQLVYQNRGSMAYASGLTEQ